MSSIKKLILATILCGGALPAFAATQMNTARTMQGGDQPAAPDAPAAAPAPAADNSDLFPAVTVPDANNQAAPQPVAAAPAEITPPPPAPKPIAMPVSDAIPGTVTPPAMDKPLVVLRFNQDFIHYDSPLYNAVKKTLEVKPAATFNVVAYYPQSSDEDRAEKNRQAAEKNAARVMSKLAEAGVPQGQARISYQPSPIANDEIKVFVE